MMNYKNNSSGFSRFNIFIVTWTMFLAFCCFFHFIYIGVQSVLVLLPNNDEFDDYWVFNNWYMALVFPFRDMLIFTSIGYLYYYQLTKTITQTNQRIASINNYQNTQDLKDLLNQETVGNKQTA